MPLFPLMAAVPSFLTEIAQWLGVLTAIGIALAAITKFKPVAWLWRRVAADPASAWFTSRSREANEPLAKKIDKVDRALEEHRKYVHYHLGPNGETKPMHKRMCAVERAVTNEGDPT